MSGLVLWMAAIAIAASLAIGIAEVGQAAVCKAHTQTAADAAALAGAAAGDGAATQAATRNETTLVSLQRSGDVYTATVTACGNTAVAHAERHLAVVSN